MSRALFPSLRILAVALIACAAFPPPLAAQFVQHGSKLTTAGATSQGYQGFSVAMSGDGNTAIVGAPFDGPTGGAWIYVRIGGSWTLQGPKLVGVDAVGAAWQGTSVDISSDGMTVIVGGMADNAYAGAAWVFTNTGSCWTQQGPKLVGSNAIGRARQGFAVSLSGDGATAIVGGPWDNIGQTDNDPAVGAAWVFTRNGSAWTEQEKLVGPDSKPDSFGQVRQGTSVDLSFNGEVALVGGPYDTQANGEGAVWFYRWNGTDWLDGVKVEGEDVSGQVAWFGQSVALAGNGLTAIVGEPYYQPDGAAWIFQDVGGTWTKQSMLVGTPGASSGLGSQGRAVALSENGDTAAVGASYLVDDPSPGAVYVFDRTGSTWQEIQPGLTPNDGVGISAFGNAVSLSADGRSLLSGGPGDDDWRGAAWIFERMPLCSSSTLTLMTPCSTIYEKGVEYTFWTSLDNQCGATPSFQWNVVGGAIVAPSQPTNESQIKVALKSSEPSMASYRGPFPVTVCVTVQLGDATLEDCFSFMARNPEDVSFRERAIDALICGGLVIPPFPPNQPTFPFDMWTHRRTLSKDLVLRRTELEKQADPLLQQLLARLQQIDELERSARPNPREKSAVKSSK